MTSYQHIGELSDPQVNDEINYWQTFGLTRDPFYESATDPIFYFSPQWEEQLDTLKQLSLSRNLLLAVTGFPFSGKTTMMNQFLAQTAHQLRSHQLNGDQNLIPERLLQLLCQAFNVPRQPAETVEEFADIVLTNIQYNNENCILVVDDADKLPHETIELLLYMIEQQSEHQMRFHVLLFGGSQLREMIRMFSAGRDEENFVFQTSIEPLNAVETKAYIQNCLHEAGWQGRFPFANKEMAEIYKLSDGIPSQIKRAARQYMKMKNNQGRTAAPTGSILNTHRTKFLAGTFTVIAIAFFAFYFDEGINQEEYLIEVPKYARNIETNDQVRIARTDFENQADAKVIEIRRDENMITHDSLSDRSIASARDNEEFNVVSINEEPSEILAQRDETLIPNITGDAERDRIVPLDIEEAKPMILVSQGVSTFVKEEMPVEETAAPRQDEIVEVARVEEPVQHEPIKYDSNVAAYSELSEPSVIESPLSTGEQHLMSLERELYTIQLVGLSSAKSMQDFIARNSLNGHVNFYKTALRDKDWFVVLLGEFNNQDEANRAIHDLPPRLQELQPWTRSFASVQKSISDFHDKRRFA